MARCAERGCDRQTQDGRRYCARCYDRRVPSREQRLRQPDPTGYTSIPCAVCGKLLRSLVGHTKVHGMTMDEYRASFPDVPVLCGELRGIRLDYWVDRGGEVYTPEQVVKALRRWASSHGGRTPSAREWRRRKSGPEHPSGPTIDKLFGSWSNALAAAGLPPIEQRYNGGARVKKVCKNGHRKPPGPCKACHAERQRRYYHEQQADVRRERFPRCSICREEGHNRQTCPSRTA